MKIIVTWKRGSLTVTQHQRHIDSCDDLHFGSQGSHSCLNEGFGVVGIAGERFSDFVQLLYGYARGLVVTIGDPDWVDSTVQQLLGLFKQRSGQH